MLLTIRRFDTPDVDEGRREVHDLRMTRRSIRYDIQIWSIWSLSLRTGGPAGPLTGVRVLALEQMQAMPFATQLLARLGADVVKVEPPGGELGRASQPSIPDPEGRGLGATFLRNNLGKRSICIDLKNPTGRQLVLDMAPRFDVVARELPSRARWTARPGLRRTSSGASPLRLRVSLWFRQRHHVALQGPARLCPHRRGDVGHLRDEAGGRQAAVGVAGRRPG